MDKYGVEIKCSDVDEGVRAALDQLGVSSEEEAEIEVVNAKTGFLGLGKKQITIRATLKVGGRAAALERELDHLLSDASQHLGDLDGAFTIVLQADGYYLTVIGPTGKGTPVSTDQVLEKLKALGVQPDLETIDRIIQEGDGSSVKVADLVSSATGPCLVKISFSKDNMEAYAVAAGPGLPTPREVEEVLGAAGVIYQIDYSAIENLCLNGPLGHPVVVARGLPPIAGAPGHIEFHFPLDKALKTLTVEAASNLLNLIEAPYVEKGTVLAAKTPPTPGVIGMTVVGETFPPPLDECHLEAGLNTAVSDDGLRLVSEIDGCIAVVDGKPHVLPVIKVSGDIEGKAGRLHYAGDILVEGNLTGGAFIRADGSVVVQGTVQRGTVIAGGSIVVLKGIVGTEGALVRSDGDIVASFIENANVLCGGNVLVSKEVMRSSVVARGEVLISGEDGVLVGGIIRAGSRVGAQRIGSSTGTPTVVESGIAFETFETLASLEERLADIRARLAKTEEALALFERLKAETGALKPKHETNANRFKLAAEAMRAEAERLSASLAEANDNISWLPDGQIEAWGVAYPGVRGTVAGLPFELAGLYERLRIRRHSGSVKFDRIGPNVSRFPVRRKDFGPVREVG